jgi:hypothetical protein
MRKSLKKLSLTRETLRRLEENVLLDVNGGVTNVDCTRDNASCISTLPSCFCPTYTCTTTPAA